MPESWQLHCVTRFCPLAFEASLRNGRLDALCSKGKPQNALLSLSVHEVTEVRIEGSRGLDPRAVA